MPSGLHKIFRGPITRGIFSKKRLPKLTTLRRQPQVVLLRHLTKSQKHRVTNDSGTIFRRGQALYNAKRLIPTSIGTTEPSLQKLRQDRFDESWRKDVSQDVADFVDDMEAQGTKLLPEELHKLLKDPATYFSRPQNVPVSLREQRYFPKWSVILLHPGPMGPYYARFRTPMEMNKLDLKDYLKSLYNVDTVHIRSYVHHGRKFQTRNGRQRGSWTHMPSLKYMIVQLVEPFKWPETDKKLLEKNPELLHGQRKAHKEVVRESMIISDKANLKLNQKHREAVSKQAQEMLQGRWKWSPTWQHLPEQRRNMLGKYADLLPQPPSDPGPMKRPSAT